MATTRLIPLHSGKGHSVAAALARTTSYVENPDKTDSGEWIASYECDPAIADQEFLFSKRQYAALTGREPKDNDVIEAYRSPTLQRQLQSLQSLSETTMLAMSEAIKSFNLLLLWRTMPPRKSSALNKALRTTAP